MKDSKPLPRSELVPVCRALPGVIRRRREAAALNSLKGQVMKLSKGKANPRSSAKFWNGN